MPDDGYEYLVSMKDEMSAPVARARDELSRFTSALKSSDAAVKHHGEAHRDAARHVREHESVLKGFFSTMARSATGGGIGGGLTSDIAKGTLIAHGVEKLGELAGEAVRFAVEASEFKENTVAAYTVIRGTAEEGERTFNELDKAAREIHMPAERAHEIAQRLMLEGLESQKAVTDTVRAVGDLQRVGLDAGASKLQAIVERSISAGHFDIGKGARGLKGTGVTFDTLAAELGMGRAKFESELKAGHISAEAGIEAIDQVVLKGKVGALATKKFTISDALVDMKNAIRGVLQETDSGPIVDAFRRMSEQFTETGQGATDTKEAINSLIELGGGLVDLASGIGTTLVSAINGLRKALSLAKDAAGGLLDALKGVVGSAASVFQSSADKKWSKQAETDVDKRVDKEIRMAIERKKLDAIGEFTKTAHSDKEIAEFAKKINVDVYNAAKAEAGGKGAITSHAAAKRALSGATGPLSFDTMSPADAFKASGRGGPDTAHPAKGSLEEMDDENARAMKLLGQKSAHSLQSGYKDANKQHSPSRAMYDLGEESALSLQGGASAAADRFDDTAAPGSSTSGGKRVHVDVSVGGIHLQGLADMSDFLPLLESQVADVFERVALELGQ